MTIYLFSLLICILSVTETLLMHIFPLDSAKNFLHALNWTRYAKMIGAKRPGKCPSTSHSSISVMY